MIERDEAFFYFILSFGQKNKWHFTINVTYLTYIKENYKMQKARVFF